MVSSLVTLSLFSLIMVTVGFVLVAVACVTAVQSSKWSFYYIYCSFNSLLLLQNDAPAWI